MNEQDNSNYEDSPSVASPLHRLRSDLCCLEDYGSVYISFQRYLREEFAISEEAADALVASSEMSALLPDQEFYENYSESAKDTFCLAVYHFAAPFYETLHTKEDTDEWMNDLMDLLLPQDTPHDRVDCMGECENGDTTWCSLGDCPVRTIAMDLGVMCLQPDFNALGYLVDAEREFTNVSRRIELAMAFNVIDSMTATNLQSCYLYAYQDFLNSK